MPFGVHPGFLVVLLIIVLIVFGPGKLPELGSAIGRGIREFRKESDKIVGEVKAGEREGSPTAPADVVRAQAPEAESGTRS